MSARRRPRASTERTPILFVDAGLAAGWRRATPDLDQLDEVVAAARGEIDDTVVMADASLKWSLPDEQQARFEEYRGTGAVLCAPGGTKGGHHAFLAAAARAAAAAGRDVWVLSALDLGDGPWRLARVRRVEGVWQIDRS